MENKPAHLWWWKGQRSSKAEKDSAMSQFEVTRARQKAKASKRGWRTWLDIEGCILGTELGWLDGC